MDEGNGLLFMRARYYDPEIGRFLTPDPLNLAQLQIMRNNPQDFTDRTDVIDLLRYGLYNLQTLNAYAYVQNNPINYIDPYGLFRWDTFGFGVFETVGGIKSFIAGLAAPTTGFGVIASPILLTEGGVLTAIGIADIIGAFYDEPPLASNLPLFFYVTPPSPEVILPDSKKDETGICD